METLIFYGGICEGQNQERRLEYYMVEESVSSTYTDMIRYGIRIIQTVIYPGGGKTVDMKQINNIFYSRDDADRFMNTAVKKKVIPEGLKKFVENYITTRITEAICV